jgi:hypothetical protein
MSDDATVRDVATCGYDLFWRTLKRNGFKVPLTATVQDGDVVMVENDPSSNS